MIQKGVGHLMVQKDKVGPSKREVLLHSRAKRSGGMRESVHVTTRWMVLERDHAFLP